LLPQLESLTTPSGGITPTDTMPVRATRSRRRARVLGLSVAVLAVAVIAGWFLLRGRAPAPANTRIVVAPLENRTGDASADDWGDLAAEWINREMDRSGVLPVTPMSSVRRFWAERAADGSRPVSELADRVGAGTVVTGYYRVAGRTVSFSMEILDIGSGELVSALDPVRGSVDSVEAVIAALAQRVVAAVAVQFDRQVPEYVRGLSSPPTLETFREFQTGVELFERQQYRDALTHFDRALAIDSTWTAALAMAAISWYNLGAYARSEALYVQVNQFRDRLTAFERRQSDWVLLSGLGGDLQAGLRVTREMARADSASGAYPAGLSASRNNRPREAMQALSAADTSEKWLGRWIPYWTVYAGATHAVGDYEAELAIARETRRRFPERLAALSLEARALIALGRVDEAWDLLHEALAYQPPGTPGRSLRAAALEFRAHGFDADAERALRQSVGWFQQHMAPSRRSGLAQSYYALGEWDAADSLYQTLFAESPEAYGYLGMLGTIAARRGDRDSALAVSHVLEETDAPYERGYVTAWRARIAAVLGDRDEAVALLLRSFEEGQPCCGWTHTDPDMRLLIGYAPYDRFVRPKG
jgi:tetratricopeptide (TPR) repeat protein